MNVKLPEPRYTGAVSLEQSLRTRRSVRSYKSEPLSLQEVAQLLWAAQGVTASGGERTAPSAGALYPLRIYVAAGNVPNLAAGVYRYDPARHQLNPTLDGDMRGSLADASLEQYHVKIGAVVFIMTAIYERVTAQYGERGVRYVLMEAACRAELVPPGDRPGAGRGAHRRFSG